MVGKIFPTMDPEHAEPLKPANFITQQDLGGDSSDYINDAATFNAPNTTAFRKDSGAFVVLSVSGVLFQIVDRKVALRQLYPIAELGKPPGTPTRSPTYIRFLPAPEQPRIEGEKLDVRDEVMAQIYNRGDPEPKRTLTFTIEVTDDGVTRGLPIYERRTFQNWRKIGTIVYDRAAPTYNGDFVLQFQHPTWRSDQNDPSTDTRVNGKKVSWGCRRTRHAGDEREARPLRIGVARIAVVIITGGARHASIVGCDYGCRSSLWRLALPRRAGCAVRESVSKSVGRRQRAAAAGL